MSPMVYSFTKVKSQQYYFGLEFGESLLHKLFVTAYLYLISMHALAFSPIALFIHPFVFTMLDNYDRNSFTCGLADCITSVG